MLMGDGGSKSLNEAKNVHVSDVHPDLNNRLFAQFPGANTTTLSADASIGDVSIDIQGADYGNFNVGDFLFLQDGTTEETGFVRITTKPGSPTLNIDRPFDNDYASATTTIEEVQPNIATANGSLVAPVSFKVVPPSNEVWHIKRFNLSATATAESSIDEFLSLVALTNGIVMRRYNNGIFTTLTNWKNDSDMMNDQYDIDPVPKPPAGKFGQRGRWWLQRADSFVRLSGLTNDYLELLVQDNLTGASLEDFQIKAQGHKEG
jgi:hypothetical protein